MRKLKEGLEILLKYCDDGNMDYSAQHDRIFFSPNTPQCMSKVDLNRLDELGFHFSDTYECFYIYT